MDNHMKQAADIALPGATFIAYIAQATVIIQFVVALLTAIWITTRLIQHFRGGRKPTAECAKSCPLISGLED